MKATARSIVGKSIFILFAMLCMGAARGVDYYPGNFHASFDSSRKTLSIAKDVYPYVTRTYVACCTYSYTDVDGTMVTDTHYSEKSLLKDSWDNITYSFDIPDFPIGALLEISHTIKGVNSDGSYFDLVPIGNGIDTKKFDTCLEKSESYWTNDEPRKFIIEGTVATGLSLSAIKLKYEVNASAFTNDAATSEDFSTSAVTATLSIESDRSFKLLIPFNGETDSLTWSMWIVSADGSERIVQTSEGGEIFKMQRKESAYVVYTWTGKGDGVSWTDPLNWSPDSLRNWGVPGYISGYPVDSVENHYYTSVACFTNSAVVNLEGGSYRMIDQGEDFIDQPYRGLVFKNEDGGDMRVVLSNGTVNVKSIKRTFIGAPGVTVAFHDAVLYGYAGVDEGDSTSNGRIGIASGSTVEFAGSRTHRFRYSPLAGNENTRFVVRDGEMECRYRVDSSIESTHEVLVSNAVWSVNIQGSGYNGLGGRVVLRDGADRQAGLKSSWAFKLDTVYDMVIPSDGYSDPSLRVLCLNGFSSAGAFVLDVTDCNRAMKVPLVSITAVNAGYLATNESSMSAITNAQPLTVYAAGESDNTKTKKRRNARLEWDAATKILYYVQDKPRRGSYIIVR